ncbi:MAG: NUDIX hydrolase [Candidatus Heimdallarchaeaceae archaeon]
MKELHKQLESIMSDEVKVKKTMNAAAGVIIRIGDNNRRNVLLIQRAADDHWPLHWEFPRGKCDKPVGEDLIHCLKREVKEETGLDITPIEKIDIHEYLADGGTRKTFCYNYLCMLKDPDQPVKLSKEHDSFKWITELGEVELMVMPEQKKTLEKIFNTERAITSNPGGDQPVQKIDEYLDQLNEIGAVFGAFIGASMAKMAYDFYQTNYSNFARQCKGLPANEKNICMLHAKARAKKAEAGKLQSGIAKCVKAKNPEKCKATLQNKFNQASATMKLSLARAAQLKKR